MNKLHFDHSRRRTSSHTEMKYRGMTLMALTTASLVQGLPKYETGDKALTVGKGDYFQETGDQVAMESETGFNVTEVKERPPRFGFPTYTTDVQSVNNVVPGLYGPVKLDIGGLVLGTIVGLGAFFILPKLLHVVGTPAYGGYKRSEDENDSTFGDMMAKIQDSLNAFNIDSTACLQRAICFSVGSASEKADNKTANALESTIGTVAKNDAVKSMLAGTEWKKAVDTAEKGEDCNLAFPKCPIEVDTLISAISKYLSS